MGTEAIAQFGLGTQAYGAGASAVAAYNKSKADQAAYDYQAQVASNNVQLDQWRAADAIARGQSAEAQQRLRTAQLKGSQRASFAARGIDLGEGSALNILTDTGFMGAQDALLIRDNAAREAWGYRQQAANDTSNAAMLRARADAESPGGAAFSTLLTGAGSVAGSWYRYKQAFGDAAPYDYADDATGAKFSQTGAAVRARR